MSSSIGGIVGTVINLVGSGMAAEEEHELALENAEYYGRQAGNEQVRAEEREELKRREIREALGQQKTGYAKSGVMITGSAIIALSETAKRGEEDIVNIRRQGQQAVEEQMRNAQSSLDQARNARRMWAFQSARQALTQGAQIYGQRTQQSGTETNSNEPSSSSVNAAQGAAADASFFAQQNQLLSE